MSACSVAVGVLSIVAVVHFAITIVLGVLIAVVCYYGKRKKAGQSKDENITYGVEDVDSASVHVYESTANVYDEIQKTREEPEKVDLGTDFEENETAEVHITNPWASSSQEDLLEREQVKEELRRESQDKPKGLDFKRTDSPKSPLGEEGGPRRRSRISIASITNTIFHRKSVDMGRDDAAAKQLMGSERESSTGPSDDCVSSTEQLDEAVTTTEEKDANNSREGYKTSMTLTFDFPSISKENESTC